MLSKRGNFFAAELARESVDRLFEIGWSKERIIADMVIDGGTSTGGRGVLDRQKAVSVLGLVPRPTPEAVRSWVRAELIHAVDWGMRRQQVLKMTETGTRLARMSGPTQRLDLGMAFSACPQDILPINCVGHPPREAHFTLGV
jgi:hypothetical protein